MTPPATRTMSAGAAPNTSFHVPAAAHTFHPLGRTATSPDQQTHVVELYDQREARRYWFKQPKRWATLPDDPPQWRRRSRCGQSFGLISTVVCGVSETPRLPVLVSTTRSSPVVVFVNVILNSPVAGTHATNRSNAPFTDAFVRSTPGPSMYASHWDSMILSDSPVEFGSVSEMFGGRNPRIIVAEMSENKSSAIGSCHANSSERVIATSGASMLPSPNCTHSLAVVHVKYTAVVVVPRTSTKEGQACNRGSMQVEPLHPSQGSRK